MNGIRSRFSKSVCFQRGKFYPQLTNLVRINTPRAVQTESRKAFRKLPNLEAAITTLCSLKGGGTTLASGLTFTALFVHVYIRVLFFICDNNL